MNPERWKQISELFHAALARDAAERATFVAEACGADQELRQDLEALLSQEGGTGALTNGIALVVGSCARSDRRVIRAARAWRLSVRSPANRSAARRAASIRARGAARDTGDQRVGVTSGADIRWKAKPSASLPVTSTRNASVPGAKGDT